MRLERILMRRRSCTLFCISRHGDYEKYPFMDHCSSSFPEASIVWDRIGLFMAQGTTALGLFGLQKIRNI